MWIHSTDFYEFVVKLICDRLIIFCWSNLFYTYLYIYAHLVQIAAGKFMYKLNYRIAVISEKNC